MKKLFSFFISLFILLSVSVAHGQTIDTRSWVNDPAHYLSATQKEQLEAQIQQARNLPSHNQIAVVILKSIDGPIDDQANAFFRKMGIGEKDKDNGILLLIAVENREYRIEVGYGLEGQFPDGKVGRFGRDTMAPLLKEQKIYETAAAFVSFVNGSEKISTPPTTQPEEDTSTLWLFFIGSAIILVLAFFMALHAKSQDVEAIFFIEFIRALFNILFFIISIMGKGKGGRFGGGSSGGGGASGKW